MSETTLSPDEQVERVRMALAEYGYPDAKVDWQNEKPHSTTSQCPPAVWWVANTLMRSSYGRPGPCWSCWQWNSRSIETDQACRNGNCAHPDADRWPPRELLVRGRGR